MTLLAAALVLAPAPAVKIGAPFVIDGIKPIAIAPAPSGSRFLVATEDGGVRIMDAKTRSTVRALAKHLQPAYGLAWSPEGTFVATGDETGRLWIENSYNGKAVRGYRRHTKGIQKLSYNIDGSLLISTGKDDQVNVYKIADPKAKEARVILGKGTNLYGAAFNPKAFSIFAVGMLNGGGGRYYDALTGQVVGFINDKDGQGIFDVAYTPGGGQLLSGGRDGNVILFDTKKKSRIGALKGHSDWVVNVAVSPNGKLAASGSTDGTVKIWDLTSYKKISDDAGETNLGSPVCFTADGTTLVTVNKGGSLQFNSLTPAQKGAEPAPAKHTPKKRTRRHH